VGLSPEQRAIDPRVTALAAFDDDDQLIACMSTFACHTTALGPGWGTYHRDWAGIAVDAVERAHPGSMAAFAPSALGDATPLRPEDAESDIPDQGEALATRVGGRVGEAMSQAIAQARQTAKSSRIEVRFGVWRPETAFKVGWPLLGGAEDGRSSLYGQCGPGTRIREGMVDSGEPDARQRPKHIAMRALQTALGGRVLSVSDWHPLHCVRIGATLFATVPGEPTTVAVKRIEERMRASVGVEVVRVLACAGDYAGYFTTPEEYAAQHYEGAHTLYGHDSLERLIERLVAIARSEERPELDWSQRDELAPDAAAALLEQARNWLSGSARGLYRVDGEVVAAFATDLRAPRVSDDAGREAAGLWRLPIDALTPDDGRGLYLALVPAGSRGVHLEERAERSRGADGAARAKPRSVVLPLDDLTLDEDAS
jgi:hypothetical protein